MTSYCEAFEDESYLVKLMSQFSSECLPSLDFPTQNLLLQILGTLERCPQYCRWFNSRIKKFLNERNEMQANRLLRMLPEDQDVGMSLSDESVDSRSTAEDSNTQSNENGSDYKSPDAANRILEISPQNKNSHVSCPGESVLLVNQTMGISGNSPSPSYQAEADFAAHTYTEIQFESCKTDESDFLQAEELLKKWSLNEKCSTEWENELDFRAEEAETMNWSWKLVTLATSPKTSDKLIQLFLNGSPSLRNQIILTLLPDVFVLATDSVAMSFLQTCFEKANSAQKWLMFQQLTGDILKLSLLSAGCRVIQTIIETKEPRCLNAIQTELQQHVLRLLEDQNGNHVLQKIIENSPLESLEFVVETVKPCVAVLAAHSYGCRIIQRLLERRAEKTTKSTSEKENYVREALHDVARIIVEKAHVLSHNQFGNYVVQHILSCGTPENKQQLHQIIKNELLAFSTQKFACNVVEKALQLSSEGERSQIIAAALQGSPPIIRLLMSDRYGNYVAQRILEFSSGTQRNDVVTIVRQNSDTLLSTPYGRHIIAAAQRTANKDPFDYKKKLQDFKKQGSK